MPDEVGACAIADHCGIGQLSEGEDKPEEETPPKWFQAFQNKYKNFFAKEGDDKHDNSEVVMNEKQKADFLKRFQAAGLSEAKAIAAVEELGKTMLCEAALKSLIPEEVFLP